MKRKHRKAFENALKSGIIKPTEIEVKGKVTVSKLNLRKKPSTKSAVVAQVKMNDILLIANTSDEWYQIVYNEKTAYVYKKYVSILPRFSKGQINASKLNVRSQPDTHSEILGKVYKGDIVTIIKEYNEWHKIDFKGKAAFVFKKYVKTNFDEDSTSNEEKKNETPSSEKYFYQREDLAKIQLEPDNKIPVPTGYKEKIAARTWNKFGGLIKVISNELDFEVESALAVLCVESGGKGFVNDRMIIRFENHVMDIYWGKKGNENEFAKFFDYDRKSRRNKHQFRSKKNGEWEKCHTNQDMEWKVFEFARKLSEKHAIYSISMGAPQVMGFNYKSIGFSSPQEMFEYFNKGIRYHLLALFDFCKYKPERIEYLQKKDFYSFSREYNGSSAPKQYEKRIKEYYDIFKKLL